MAYSDVQVLFEFGHRSALRTKVTPEGYTHDWEVFVRGADNAEISHFVEKVVFYLHETFPKPKRVIKEPPYCVKESGYAGFNLLIDIYFKNKDEPKKFKHNYDLNLQNSGPPIIKTLREKYVFTNPTGDFRKKLLKGGGVSEHPIGIDAPLPHDKPFGDGLVKSQKAPSSLLIKQPPPELVKKHKKEPELKPTSQFSELFGDPIKKTKVSPDPKKHLTINASKSSASGGGKGPSSKQSSSSEKPSSSDKSKLGPPKDEKREEKKRDKSKDTGDKKVAKPSSPSLSIKMKEEVKLKEEPVEKKKKDKKYKEEKESKSKHQPEKLASDKFEKMLSKEKESKKSPKAASSSLSLLEEKMRHKESEKQHKSKHKKKDKEKKDKKSESKDKKRESKSKEEIKFKEPEPHSPSPPAPTKNNIDKPSPFSQREKAGNRPLKMLFDALSDNDNSDSNNSISGDEDLMEFPPPVKVDEVRRDVGGSAPKRRDVDKKAKKEEEKKRKRKRSTDSEEEAEAPRIKKEPISSNQEMLPPPPVPVTTKLRDLDMTPEYESELRELERKINNLDNDAELQRLVNLITETGKYELTKKTFDFDLCALDRTTVTRLQDFFRAL